MEEKLKAVADRASRSRRRERDRRERRAFQRNAPMSEGFDPVELASILSFPASDSPAWIARRPKKS